MKHYEEQQSRYNNQQDELLRLLEHANLAVSRTIKAAHAALLVSDNASNNTQGVIARALEMGLKVDQTRSELHINNQSNRTQLYAMVDKLFTKQLQHVRVQASDLPRYSYGLLGSGKTTDVVVKVINGCFLSPPGALCTELHFKVPSQPAGEPWLDFAIKPNDGVCRVELEFFRGRNALEFWAPQRTRVSSLSVDLASWCPHHQYNLMQHTLSPQSVSWQILTMPEYSWAAKIGPQAEGDLSGAMQEPCLQQHVSETMTAAQALEARRQGWKPAPMRPFAPEMEKQMGNIDMLREQDLKVRCNPVYLLAYYT